MKESYKIFTLNKKTELLTTIIKNKFDGLEQRYVNSLLEYSISILSTNEIGLIDPRVNQKTLLHYINEAKISYQSYTQNVIEQHVGEDLELCKLIATVFSYMDVPDCIDLYMDAIIGIAELGFGRISREICRLLNLHTTPKDAFMISPISNEKTIIDTDKN